MTAPSAVARSVRVVSLGLLLFVVLGAVSTARTVFDGRGDLERSTEAFNRGDLHAAILFARRSASAYVPGAPHVDAAYARLRAIALGAESSGDKETAQLAWGAVRSAALESRHFWIPRQGDLETATRRLELLSLPTASAELRGGRVPVVEVSPRPLWSLLLALGFLLSIAGLASLGFYAARPDGTFRRERALLGLGLALSGIACWTISLYWA